MSRLPGINAALAASVRRVNAQYAQIPEDRRPGVDGERWRVLEAELDGACAKGEEESALAAVERWEAHARKAIEVAT